MAKLGSVPNALVILILVWIIDRLPVPEKALGFDFGILVDMILVLSVVLALLAIVESLIESARDLITAATETQRPQRG